MDEQEVTARYDGQVAYLTADVGKAGDAPRVVAAVLERFGRFDLLINNAATGSMTPLVEATDEVIERELGVNLVGVLRFCREAVAPLRKSKG